MHWVYLILGILCEVSGTTCMKLSQGFTRPMSTVLMCCFYLLSLNGLNLALKRIDVSVAYAVWAAIGTALVATVGLLWFNEPLGPVKVVSLCLIVAGVVGLNIAGASHQPVDDHATVTGVCQESNSEVPDCGTDEYSMNQEASSAAANRQRARPLLDRRSMYVGSRNHSADPD
jgi:small multidrug resistance pump